MLKNHFKLDAFILFITAIGFLVSITAGTVTIKYPGNIVSDAEVESSSPTYNGGNYSWGTVGYYSSNNIAERTYLLIPIPDLIYNVSPARITKASINITFTFLWYDGLKICLNEVFDKWNESLINWNNQPTFNNTPLDTITLVMPHYFTDTVVSFDITRLLKKQMISDELDINVLLKALHENPSEKDNFCTISTSDESSYLRWPYLVIESPDLPDTLITDLTVSIKKNTLNNTKLTSKCTLLNPLIFHAGQAMQKHFPVIAVQSNQVFYNIAGRKLVPFFH